MNRWTFPFSPDPYCKISVRGNEDWTWEKASKSLTVIVVNSSPVPGSFIYCKSLHLPEPWTNRGFYWGPLGASLMCATIYFNINILHMYRNIYSKRWETDCFRRPGGFLFFFDGGGRWGRALRVNNKELSDASDETMKANFFTVTQFQPAAMPSKILRNAFHAWHMVSGRGRANQAPMIFRWRIKTPAQDFFQRPSARRLAPLLKCPLKRWFVCWSGELWPCRQVIYWALSHVKRSCKTGPAYTCDAPWDCTVTPPTLTKHVQTRLCCPPFCSHREKQQIRLHTSCLLAVV